ncbi:hypothetical protein L208DRAFT_1380420 [Tricholoma matsutake]|nr:hypothetical protein L208DRAFT_1380420 [Tricholoma matsutake 945]
MHMTTLMLIILLLVTIARMLFWLGSHSITVLFIIRSCLSLFMAVATLHKVGLQPWLDDQRMDDRFLWEHYQGIKKYGMAIMEKYSQLRGLDKTLTSLQTCTVILVIDIIVFMGVVFSVQDLLDQNISQASWAGSI